MINIAFSGRCCQSLTKIHRHTFYKFPIFQSPPRSYKLCTQIDAKKQKKERNYEHYTFEINGALVRNFETRTLRSLLDENVTVIQGIGPKSQENLKKLGIETVKELGEWEYFKIARAMLTLEETAEGNRAKDSQMNIDWAVDKEYENKSLSEILDAPVDAIQGLSENAAKYLGILQVKTVRDLGTLRSCRWAEAICKLAEYEDNS